MFTTFRNAPTTVKVLVLLLQLTDKHLDHVEDRLWRLDRKAIVRAAN
jgi:hypothetical protein